MPPRDDCLGPGSPRPEGRKTPPSYLWEVKKPSERKGAWDSYKPLASTPADQAFRPMDQGACPLVKS